MIVEVLYLADLAAIGVLVFGIYLPRHRRKDLVLAYLGVNTGVLAVTAALVEVEATLGLGLGLFGVLSIIRLRSAELGQREIAYYFAALTLGLLGGLGDEAVARGIAMMAVIVLVFFFADHPRFMSRQQRRTMVLDGALTTNAEIAGAVQRHVPGRIQRVDVMKVDHVDLTTLVDVRYDARRPPDPSAAATILDRQA